MASVFRFAAFSVDFVCAGQPEIQAVEVEAAQLGWLEVKGRGNYAGNLLPILRPGVEKPDMISPIASWSASSIRRTVL